MATDVRIAVFGSSSISVPIFDAIAERYTVVLAVISERARVERGQVIENPVQQWAASRSIPVMNGADVPSDILRQTIRANEVDLVFLCSYGKLLPQDLLDSPRLASINCTRRHCRTDARRDSSGQIMGRLHGLSRQHRFK